MSVGERTIERGQRILFAAVALLVPVCLYVIFAVVPNEQKMGIVQRIFYFHVPSAFMAFLGVFLCAACSALYLVTRERRYDIVAHAAAELGVVFCKPGVRLHLAVRHHGGRRHLPIGALRQAA